MHLIQGGGVWGGGDSVCAPRPAHVVCMGMGTDQCIWAVSTVLKLEPASSSRLRSCPIQPKMVEIGFMVPYTYN